MSAPQQEAAAEEEAAAAEEEDQSGFAEAAAAGAGGGTARWAKVLDQDRCIGCHACTVACKAEHLVPLGVNRIYVNSSPGCLCGRGTADPRPHRRPPAGPLGLGPGRRRLRRPTLSIPGGFCP